MILFLSQHVEPLLLAPELFTPVKCTLSNNGAKVIMQAGCYP